MISGHRVGAAAPPHIHVSTTHTYSGELDLIAIEQAMNGRLVTLTIAERIEAARQLRARGMSLDDIATRLGVSRTVVTTWRDADWTRPAINDPEPIDIGAAKHGRSGYTKGCRCRTCRNGAAAASRESRARRRAAA